MSDERADQPPEPDAAAAGEPQTVGTISTLSFWVTAADGTLRQPAQWDAVPALGSSQEILQQRYRLLRELGRGGMGCVYLARDERLDRLVAIKVVAAHGRSGQRPPDDALAHEARMGAGLNHQAIAAVYDFGFHRGRAFTVFEFVDGDGLREMLESRRQFPLPDVQRIVAGLAPALDFAHSRGIVHRDLKPENVRASKQGQFKILDLGLAQEFRRNRSWETFAGTPAYASPEQAAGLPSDGRTDQYALAVMTYEMLAGSRPFDHADPWELLQMHLHCAPPPPSRQRPDLPPSLCGSICRALDKNPEARFASCEEFAAALGAVPSSDRRHSLAAPLETDLAAIYISHAGENSPMARQLAAALERHGYRCWYYERDALPGISHVAQTNHALKHAHVVLLLLSGESVSSADVDREVREAHHLHRPLLPVLLGLTRQEFQQRQPDWQPIVGSAAMVELTAANVASVVTRLARTLELWEVPRAALPIRDPAAAAAATPLATLRPPAPPARAPRRPRPISDRKIWASDANQIEIEDLGHVVFRNAAVDDFLQRRNKFFLSASKGLGKTLLLTFKRSLLSDASASSGQGVLFVPQGRPYLDFMTDVRSLSRQHERLLSELTNTKRMWSLALGVSALSHHPGLLDTEDRLEVERFPRRIQAWLRGAPIEPTVVFKELLGQSVREINRLVDQCENFLDHKTRQIHSATFFFIDKVDQALRQLGQAAWVQVQAGLIEAAWDLMNANSHIKVHASIRQEAFSNYESDIKANLFGATTTIRYSEQELHAMLDQLAECYEGCESFQDFVTLNVVRHPRRPFPEDSFRYVRRHTLGRPRDLVIIASELSAKRAAMNELTFCNVVNESSAAGLVANIFDEMRVFLNCLTDRPIRQRFFSLLPCNVLTRAEAIRACCEFNGLSEDDYSYYQSLEEGLHHPFSDLYRVGLLGSVAWEQERGRYVQKFKQPHDMLTEAESEVPDSPYYLIHPALDDHISQLQLGQRYQLFQHIIIGDGQVWEDYFPAFLNLERGLFGLQRAGVLDELTRTAGGQASPAPRRAASGRRERPPQSWNAPELEAGPGGEPVDPADSGSQSAAFQVATYRLMNQARLILASDRRPHLRAVLEASPDLRYLRERCQTHQLDDFNYWLEELIELGD